MKLSDAANLDLMRASMLLDSDPAAAALAAVRILAGFPGHEESSLMLAAALRRVGDAASAVPVLESLVRLQPDSPVMHLELGRLYAGLDRSGEAIASFRRVVDLDADFADGWRDLAAQWFLVGDERQGDAAYANFTRLMPDPPELTDVHIALAGNRLDAAESILKLRLQQAPNDVVALRLSADVAARVGDRVTAEAQLQRALVLAPGYAAARHALARLLYSQQRIGEALPLIERLLATEPDNAGYLSLKAQSIRFIGRSQESIALMERAVASRPDDASLLLMFGNLLRETGEQARAIHAYRSALVLQPGLGEAYWCLANLKTARFTDEDVAAMQLQLARSSALGADRTHLEFALGKAFEDAAQFALSFEHYARGNARQRASIEYDPDATRADVERSQTLYMHGFFAGRSGWGLEQVDPIFIIGLPRSGSTLLEQILASHSQVEGTRELLDMPDLVRELMTRPGADGAAQYPLPVAALSRADIETLAARYLERTRVHRPLGRPRFVDKMLSNFGHVGLIHLMFPRAAIIDARRHPLGCGLSCYKQLFARGVNFSYDLAEIGSYYRDYFDLMEHVDRVLPGRVHRVHYEQLVADPETEVRKLLDYCGLPFEAQCLRFYDNSRVVQTISSEQVRSPIYADGVAQWRHYEPWLDPLKLALGSIVGRYPLAGPPAA